MKKHIAGVVPVAGFKTDFQLPWHASLMPISHNYLAVERAVAECAYAGCNTIWVVCNDDVTPLIRYQLGEKIEDPVYNYRYFEHNKGDFKRPIKIYYVPLAVRDIRKRDNLAWSAMYGALTANNITKRISKWLTPDKFYISWPYGCYDPSFVRAYRKNILETSFAASYNGKTVKDNLYLGLTLDLNQVDELFSEVKTSSTGLWKDPEARTEKLPMDERFSYKDFDLQKVFSIIDMQDYEVRGIDKYCPIDSWDNYRKMLSSDIVLKKPSWLKSTEWNEIGYEE